MRIGSLNVRGLGSDAKKDDVAEFCYANDLDFGCLQETKLENFSDRDGRRLWKAKEVRWCAEGSVGRSGGLLTWWDDSKFACTSSWSIGGAVVVNGRWRSTMEELCIINVYVSCNRDEKRKMWDKLSMVVTQAAGSHICVIGDFNSILDEGERNGMGWWISSKEMLEFKNFVKSNGLMDVALQGRKYTWYKPDGTLRAGLIVH